MTLRAFFLERLEAELPVFLRVLRAIPADRASYKPAEPSSSAEQIVSTLALEWQVCAEVAKTYRGEWRELPSLTLAEKVALFERSVQALIAEVKAMDEAAWEKPAEFYWQGQLANTQPAGAFFWFILFDAIHHRGQLTTYLRPMGAKVPAIYGPSADDQGQA